MKLEDIKEWAKINKPDYIVLETKTERKNKKMVRYVLIKEVNSEKTKWVLYSTFKNNKKIRMDSFSFKYTNESIQKELNIKYGYIDLVDDFANVKKKCKFFCKKHLTEFYSFVDLLLFKNKYGCPICTKINKKTKLKTHENFENELKNNERFSEYELLSKYKGLQNKLKIKHKKCGNIFYMTANNFKNGQGCPKCAKIKRATKNKKTHMYFINKLKQCGTFENYVILSQYDGLKNKILVKYKKCGCESYALPSSLLRGYGCNVCATKEKGKNKRKSHEQFLNEINKKYPNQFEIISKYSTRESVIEVKHVICGNVFKIKASNLLNSGSCSVCKMSSPESKAFQFLKENNIEFEYQKYFKKCKLKNILPFDFYLKGQNTIIEIDGRFHFMYLFGETLEKRRERDIVKNRFCFFNNIKLIRIPYWEFDKISEIIKNNLSL